MWLPLVRAARCIRDGGVVAYPTETVYGLGCDPLNEDAVKRICAIKNRPLEKGLILLAAELAQLHPFVHLSKRDYEKLDSHWPVGVTYLLPATDAVPFWISGGAEKVAVRVSSHALSARLAGLADIPIVSTSCNLSGQPACRNRFQVHKHFHQQLDYIVEGDCGNAGQASRIIDFDSGQRYR